MSILEFWILKPFGELIGGLLLIVCLFSVCALFVIVNAAIKTFSDWLKGRK